MRADGPRRAQRKNVSLCAGLTVTSSPAPAPPDMAAGYRVSESESYDSDACPRPSTFFAAPAPVSRPTEHQTGPADPARGLG